MTEKLPPPPDAQDDFSTFSALACAADFLGMRAMVVAGFDLMRLNQHGDTILEVVIRDLPFSQGTPRHMVIKEMLSLGADAKQRNADGSGPLFSAVLNMDTEVIGILMDAGADPNLEQMDSAYESLYDWAEFDYQYEVWDLSLPQEEAATDRADEDSWLRYLDRLAIQHGKQRPEHLIRLRQGGAMSMTELNGLPSSPHFGTLDSLRKASQKE